MCFRYANDQSIIKQSSIPVAEGALYYSDQQFISVGRDDERTTLTQQQALTKFGEFIRTFQVDNKSSSFPYAYVDDVLWD